jgi:hypothetical protein
MGIISTGPGSPLVVSGASGGKVYGYNNIGEAAARVVAQVNTSRQSIIFHNPGASDIFVAPANVQNVLGTAPTQPSNAALTPSNAALGGSFRVYGNGGSLTITGECAGAWQAIAITGAGTTNPLTVMESNV